MFRDIVSIPPVIFFFTLHFERWWPAYIRKYIFVNIGDESCLKPFDGREMLLNPDAFCSPHPNLFLLHENNARYVPKNFAYRTTTYTFLSNHQPVPIPITIWPIFPVLSGDLINELPAYWTWESIEIQNVVMARIIENTQDVELTDNKEEEEMNEGLSDGTTLEGSDTESCEAISSEGEADETLELPLHSLVISPHWSFQVQRVE